MAKSKNDYYRQQRAQRGTILARAAAERDKVAERKAATAARREGER